MVLFPFKGLTHLAGAFSKLPHGLVFLSLADNGITSKGIYLNFLQGMAVKCRNFGFNLLLGTLLRDSQDSMILYN